MNVVAKSLVRALTGLLVLVSTQARCATVKTLAESLIESLHNYEDQHRTASLIESEPRIYDLFDKNVFAHLKTIRVLETDAVGNHAGNHGPNSEFRLAGCGHLWVSFDFDDGSHVNGVFPLNSDFVAQVYEGVKISSEKIPVQTLNRVGMNRIGTFKRAHKPKVQEVFYGYVSEPETVLNALSKIRVRSRNVYSEVSHNGFELVPVGPLLN